VKSELFATTPSTT